MSTQTVTTTTCDSCGKVKQDGDEGWAHLTLYTEERVAVVDAHDAACAGALTSKLVLGEIGEEVGHVAIGDSTAHEVRASDDPVIPARFANRCPVKAANASECWDTLPKKQPCLKHGTPADR